MTTTAAPAYAAGPAGTATMAALLPLRRSSASRWPTACLSIAEGWPPISVAEVGGRPPKARRCWAARLRGFTCMFSPDFGSGRIVKVGQFRIGATRDTKWTS